MGIRKKIALILNCVIFLNVTVISIIGIIFGAGKGQAGNYIIGWGYLKPYTMDSNIFTGVVALIVIVSILKNIKNDEPKLPAWLMKAYLMGATNLVLTFLIAALFLAPSEVMNGNNYFILFSKDMFFFHFMNPLLATVSLVVLLNDRSFSFADRFIGMIPTIIYSIVYFLMVVVLKCWNDFYNFTFGGRYYLIPIVIVVIYGVTFLISYMLTRIHNHFCDRHDCK